MVSYSIDDSTKYVGNCIDAMDKYGIKATIFVSARQDPAPEDRFFTQRAPTLPWLYKLSLQSK